MRVDRIHVLVRESDPVPFGQRPGHFPDKAALLEVIDERTNAMATPTIKRKALDSPSGPRRAIPVLIGGGILAVALLAVVILSGDRNSDVASLDTAPEVAEAFIGAFLGGDGDLAVELIHPENGTFGDISDPVVQSEVRGFAAFFAAIGTEYEASCEELVGPTVQCSMSANNDLYRAVDEGPAFRPSFTVGVSDGKVLVSPSVPPPSLAVVDSHFRIWSRENYAADFDESCPGLGFDFVSPICADFIHDHLDEWADAWRAEKG